MIWWSDMGEPLCSHLIRSFILTVIFVGPPSLVMVYHSPGKFLYSLPIVKDLKFFEKTRSVLCKLEEGCSGHFQSCILFDKHFPVIIWNFY